MTLKQFVDKWVGKKADWDGYYAGQCVDLFRYFCHEVLEISQPDGVWGAANFWTEFETDSILKANFIKIPNTRDFIPQPGDVMIWDFNAGGGYGHVAIVIDREHTLDYFYSFDQNWSRISYCEIVKHNYNNVFGVLRPKNFAQGDEENNMSVLHDYLGVTDDAGAKNRLKEHLGEYNGKCDWGNENDDRGGFLGSARRDVKQLREKSAKLESERNTAIQSEKKTAIKLSETEELLNKKTKELAQCQLEAEQHTCEYTENDVKDAHDDGYNEARAEYRPYDYRELSAFDLIGNGILKLLGKNIK